MKPFKIPSTSTTGGRLYIAMRNAIATQLELRERTGISVARIRKFLNDEATPTRAEFDGLAKALDVSVERLDGTVHREVMASMADRGFDLEVA